MGEAYTQTCLPIHCWDHRQFVFPPSLTGRGPLVSALATQEGLVGQSCHYYRIQLYHPRRVLKIVESSTNITVILEGASFMFV